MIIPVNLEQNPYKVFVDEELKLEFKGKVAILTNPKVAGLHLQNLLSHIKADELFIITIKDGEKYKNLASIELILDQMFNSRLDRKSTLIGFGGGVITDMAGFAASIYQRGIDFVNIPTTLLAMVDAAVGGKTGVNSSFGKNLIGSFYQPKAVHCKSEFLRTLGARELAAAMAEYIKMAVMFDEKELEFIANLDENAFLNANLSSEIYAQIIAKSVALKVKIVEQDEKESALRMLLNYGHTFAHIIERQSSYKLYLHGEAVSIGMIMANELALNLGLLNENQCEKIKALCEKFKLPTYYEIEGINEFYEAFFLDKKSLNARLHFILPQGFGKGIIKNDVPKELILKTLATFGKANNA